MSFDFNGLSTVIPVAVAGLGALVTVGMQVVSFLDARKAKKVQTDLKTVQDQLLALSIERDKRLAEVKALVNGASDKLLIKATKEAFEQGRQHERENGAVAPSPSYPKPRVDELLEAKQAEMAAAAPPATGS